MASIAERLRTLREQAGLTQEELAEKSGVNMLTLRNYEQGRREPSWRAFLDLCKALGADPMGFDRCVAGEEAPPAKRGKPGKRPK